MELLLITATRLKIVMSSEDMEKYDLLCDDPTCDDPDTKRAIRCILEQAKVRVGFDVGEERLFVQMFPSKDGGCEMYVTKSDRGDVGRLPIPIHKPDKRQTASVFRFTCLENLLGACRHLRFEEEIGESKAYFEKEKSDCYLVLYTVERDAFGRNPCCFSVANEYGSQMKNELCMAYLNEHCRCICAENAVEVLGELY